MSSSILTVALLPYISLVSISQDIRNVELLLDLKRAAGI